jgi:hypothetical protein
MRLDLRWPRREERKRRWSKSAPRPGFRPIARRRGSNLAASNFARKAPIVEAVSSGRAIAWKNKAALGALFARDEVALVAVRHEGVAKEVQRVRAIADAASSLAKV